MPIAKEEFDKFEALIDPTAPKAEVECAKYLEYATMCLFPSFPGEERTVSWEHRMYFGRSDFLVVGDFTSDIGRKERRVYFWEVKAAQCFAFQKDDSATRVRPTTDLIKAETQLIHYVEEAQGSETFRELFEVKRKDIKMGGIIIGRDGRLWDPATKGVSSASAEMSLSLRTQVIYDAMNIRLMTWDRIADILRPTP